MVRRVDGDPSGLSGPRPTGSRGRDQGCVSPEGPSPARTTDRRRARRSLPPRDVRHRVTGARTRLRRRGPGQPAQLRARADQGGVSRFGPGHLRRPGPVESQRPGDRSQRHLQLPARRPLQALCGRHPHGPCTGHPATDIRSRVPAAAGWRQALEGLATAEDDPEPPISGLALQIAVEHPGPSRFATSSGPRITIRPMRRGKGKGGQWIKTGASWRDITAPLRLLAQRRRSTAAGRREVPDGQRPARPRPLAHPERAPRPVRSRPLVPARTGGRGRRRADRRAPRRHRRAVLLHGPARVDLTADETGDVTLSASFTLDDEPLHLPDGAQRAPRHATPRPVDQRRRPAGPRRPRRASAPDRRPTGRHRGDHGARRTTSTSCSTSTSRPWPATPRSTRPTAASPSPPAGSTASSWPSSAPPSTRATLRWSARYRRGERTTDHPLHAAGRPQPRPGRGGGGRRPSWGCPPTCCPRSPTPTARPATSTVSGPDVVTLLTEVVPWLRGERRHRRRGRRRPARRCGRPTEDPLDLAARHRRRRRPRRSGGQRLVRPRRRGERRRPDDRLRPPLRRARPRRRGA